MWTHALIAASDGGISPWLLALAVFGILVIVSIVVMAVKQYKRCPSNRILVIYGRIAGSKASRCIHGGGVFVVPLVQDYGFLSLEPLTIPIELDGALSLKNIRVNVPSTFTIGISTNPTIMTNAAERLLNLTERDIIAQASDIILGQMRLVIATLSIEEINQDREKFLDLANKNVDVELNKIGLEVINVNIRDITDESGYIEAIGQKAAAEAINKAKVEVAEQDRSGAIGQATANREKEVKVRAQHAESTMGQKEQEMRERRSVAQYDAEAVAAEASSMREREVAVAQQTAEAETGKKQADRDKRVAVAAYEAEAVKGENESKAEIADYNAALSERQADAKRKGEVALANSQRDILTAEKEQEVARLEKTQLAQQEVEKRKVQVDAEAEAERRRRVAKGEADAILAKYKAEAEGIQSVLEGKAQGYDRMLKAVGGDGSLVPTLLVVEQLPELIAEQVRAIQNLEIDKITVWDSGNGNGEGGSTANFLRSMIGALPPIHDLARNAGIDLPNILGRLSPEGASADADAGAGKKSEPAKGKKKS